MATNYSVLFIACVSLLTSQWMDIVDGAHDHERAKYLPQEDAAFKCDKKTGHRRYLLYDVNWGEGFNLRRDVYVRIAVFAKHLQDAFRECDEDGSVDYEWVLVLPPWGPLYHWQSRELGDQFSIPWKKFFDLESLQKFIRVIEFADYLDERFGPNADSAFIDQIYYLQQFPFNGNWEPRIKEEECKEKNKYEQDEHGDWRGFFWGYQDRVYAKGFSCLTVMGHASIMKDFINSDANVISDEKEGAASVLLDRAETLLHDNYGDSFYWMARRSMVFSSNLRAVGDSFRAKFLQSNDEDDGTILDPDWTKNERKPGIAEGGPYLAIHLRRKDYVHARPTEVPSLKSAAIQTKKLLKKLNLTRVFVSSDAPDEEIETFQSLLKRKKTKNGVETVLPYSVFRYKPSMEELKDFGDGGVAIIDQWIAAHARYFAGSHQSTFSFRIQEERQILGFHPDTIFNRLCGTNKECEPPSKWLIVY